MALRYLLYGSHMLKLIIDDRETETAKAFEEMTTSLDDIEVEVKRIDVGDFQFWLDDKLLLVIERKTYSDLAASIKDNRYREQKFRLKELTSPNSSSVCRVIYIIEGERPQTKKFDGLPTSTLESSLLSTVIRDNFPVITTKNQSETVLTLKLMLTLDNTTVLESPNNKDVVTSKFIETICKKVKQCDTGSATDLSSTGYAENVIHNKKKSKMTSEVTYISQLALVPGLSIKMAEKIAELYPSMSKLISAYDLVETRKEKEKLFEKVRFKINSNERNIGPAISKRLYEYLFNIEYSKEANCTS